MILKRRRTASRSNPCTVSKALAEGFRDTSHAECPFSGSTEIWPPESRRNPLAEPWFPSTRLTPETLPPQLRAGAGAGAGANMVIGFNNNNNKNTTDIN